MDPKKCSGTIGVEGDKSIHLISREQFWDEFRKEFDIPDGFGVVNWIKNKMRIGTGARQQFEAELGERFGIPAGQAVVPWIEQRIEDLGRAKLRIGTHEENAGEAAARIAELEKQNEELREDACAANMLATERKAGFDAEHKRAAKLEKELTEKSLERQDLLNRIAKQSAIIRDNEHVIDQQHDHIRQIETKNQELLDHLGSVTAQRDEAEKNIDCFYHEDDVVPEQDESRQVVVDCRVVSCCNGKGDYIIESDGEEFIIVLRDGGEERCVDKRVCQELDRLEAAGHRARLTLEILDKPEPTLAECWNLIRDLPVGYYNHTPETLNALTKCWDAAKCDDLVYQAMKAWEVTGTVPPHVLAVLDAFFKETNE